MFILCVFLDIEYLHKLNHLRGELSIYVFFSLIIKDYQSETAASVI